MVAGCELACQTVRMNCMHGTGIRICGLRPVACVAVVVVAAGGAFGQTDEFGRYEGWQPENPSAGPGDGTALDANLNPWSGGVNPRGRNIDAIIQLNNAIVTGNAGFGRSFRGDVGYLAPREFTGALGTGIVEFGGGQAGGLGSTEYFAFERDSIGASLSASRGIRGTSAVQLQVALATGDVPPSILSGFRGWCVVRAGTTRCLVRR